MKKAFGLAVLMMLLISCDKTEPKPLAGAYATREVDAEIFKAAEFAIEAQQSKEKKPLKLVQVVKAEQQVVAGMNYRLLLKVGLGSAEREAEAVVYRNLEAKYSLSSWTWRP